MTSFQQLLDKLIKQVVHDIASQSVSNEISQAFMAWRLFSLQQNHHSDIISACR